MKNLFTLSVIRKSLLATMPTIIEVAKHIAPIYELPLKWLHHYIEGTGEDMVVPYKTVLEAKSAFDKAIVADNYNHLYDTLEGRYCVNSSVLYEGSGFADRPPLFYLLGGFSFTVSKVEYDGTAYAVVSGTDHYDWHAADEEGHYYTSPLGDGNIIKAMLSIAGKLFGEQYFPLEGWPMKEAGISNQLWEDLKLVGAKEFDSRFTGIPMWKWESLMACVDAVVYEGDPEYAKAWLGDNGPYLAYQTRCKHLA